MSSFKPTDEQSKVLDFSGKNLIVSASAGSGKTSTLIEFITRLVAKGQPIKRILLLTFTKAASFEMKERLIQNFYEEAENDNVLNAIDDVPTSDISTIHAFLERIIKRNTNILPISEGFIVLGQEEIDSLRMRAFEQTEKEFKKNRAEDYQYFFLRFHNDRNQIFAMLNDMSSFFSTQTDVENKIKKYKSSQKEFFDYAISSIDKMFITQIESIRDSLARMKMSFVEDKYISFIDKLLLSLAPSENNLKLYQKLALTEMRIPACGKNCDQLLYFSLKEEYERLKLIKADLVAINVLDERVYDRKEFGHIENIIYDFYSLYEKCYADLKEKLNAVDFNDLEKFAKIILSNEEIKSQIQTDYDFIFIDEYQDTNRVQEEIVKEIALKSHFIAVGDPKQGIYGFRNATSEIIKKDIRDFIADEKSSAEFLRKNFRSDAYILNFVNNVFVNVMKDETVGIDYVATSMLMAGDESQEICDAELPSVRLDIVDSSQTEERSEPTEVYDISLDETLKKSSKTLEAKVIATRIQELMFKKIYDGKQKTLRNINYKDIAILTRGRSELVNEIIKELTAQKIPVVSDIKGNFKDYSEILVLINLFKLMLDFQDDTALLSVMLSKIGGFSVDELAQLRLNGEEKEFFSLVLQSNNEKVKKFLRALDEYRFLLESNGAFAMLEELFDRTNYREYILSKQSAQNYIFVLDKFMEQIKNSEFKYDLASLVKFLGQEKIDFKGGGNSSNAVTICTIHSSKGLEYPVVILVDTGRAMLQTNKNRYVLSEDFGLALNYFSREDDEVLLSPLVYLLKLGEREKQRKDEIMLLYVALTRAQRHLYITGTMKAKNLESVCDEPLKAKSYLEIMLSGYKKLYLENLKEELTGERVECNIISQVEQLPTSENNFIGVANEEDKRKIQDYLSFEYAYNNSAKTVYKNSVSSLNDAAKTVGFIGKQDDEFIERGNAYHLALKLIDFDHVDSLDDAEKMLLKLDNEEINKYVDSEILFKNILLLKEVLPANGHVYKEQQFTSLVNLKQVFLDATDEEIMIQGVVDLFAIGDKNVLIDYKFTNDNSDKNIKNRYEKQLKLYKNAIENAFNVKLDEIYLLSLKNNKLINF